MLKFHQSVVVKHEQEQTAAVAFTLQQQGCSLFQGYTKYEYFNRINRVERDALHKKGKHK